MNEYDSSLISNILKKKLNYKRTNVSEQADILILNTCSIREKAQEKLFHQLGRWKTLKKNKKDLIIAVGGCVATQEKKKIYKRAPLVNIIFGPKTIHRLPKMIEELELKKKKICNVNAKKIKKYSYYKNNITQKISAYISIMEGCNKFCSYCIVPRTRGREINRTPQDILLEANFLAKNGTKEITLLGQNVNSYISKFSNGSICNFSQLIELISNIQDIKRIKFLTSNPMEFTDDLIKIYKNIPKLSNSLHLPVQSGSNKILKKMRRKYTISEYKEIIKKIRKYRPNIYITSDFIVGFPGETHEDFKKTLKLIKDIKFDMSFSFIYSPRPGTPAYRLHDEINLQEKKERLYLLQKKINKNTKFFSQKMIGTYQKVLVEKQIYVNKIKKLCGKTTNNRLVIFEGSKKLIGKCSYIKILQANMQTLQGKYVK
ncbi:tRNA (N6-isopentenyl adenosine(37)-C2)-methylthiotransferase MiaB [Buchnera aphidicola]|nr:tRNA (N6-isopentenyl adenosine(37)-C2)-methylthiotransferase MiaB [Buchnera aphidicola]USS94404.1 tRNA (N6-isopentenyl adenosine(37)-C2)-methylthiotransferase MiaB [Buchnera aphidicola (Sipha maydis)]